MRQGLCLTLTITADADRRESPGDDGAELAGPPAPGRERPRRSLLRDLDWRFRAGEPAALTAVYHEHVDSVRRVAERALRRASEVERQSRESRASDVADIVQEVFARAFAPAARQRFNAGRDHGPYLRAVAWNLATDLVRKRRRHQRVLRLFHDLVRTLGRPSRIEHEGRFADSLPAVALYVAELPADLRATHEALYVQGLSQRDAATVLGVGRQVVRSNNATIMRGLACALERVGVRGLFSSD